MHIHTHTHTHTHTDTHTYAHTHKHIYTNTYHLISASTLKTPHSRFLLVKVRAPSSGDPPWERKDSRRREPGRGESELPSVS